MTIINTNAPILFALIDIYCLVQRVLSFLSVLYDPSPKPVYLTDKRQQSIEFYIRAGNQTKLLDVEAATIVPVFIEHWDGKSWKVASLPQAPVGQLTVLAVVGGKVWAAGTTYIGDQQAPAQLVEMSC